jgi:hypothetical protein
MIALDKNGDIIIITNIKASDISELHNMKQTVLDLLATQNKEFHDPDNNYWGFELVKLLDPKPEQICIKNN